jgi:hypothetical protein
MKTSIISESGPCCNERWILAEVAMYAGTCFALSQALIAAFVPHFAGLRGLEIREVGKEWRGGVKRQQKPEVDGKELKVERQAKTK